TMPSPVQPASWTYPPPCQTSRSWPAASRTMIWLLSPVPGAPLLSTVYAYDPPSGETAATSPPSHCPLTNAAPKGPRPTVAACGEGATAPSGRLTVAGWLSMTTGSVHEKPTVVASSSQPAGVIDGGIDGGTAEAGAAGTGSPPAARGRCATT